MPPPADAGALGVDVADYQHAHGAAIDWPQVAAAGYKFAFIKATEGDYYANPYYASDLAQAKAAGLYATGYHFAIPNVSDGASQADYAVGNGGYAADGRTLPLALDIEYNPYGAECYGLSSAQMVAWVSAFTSEAQRLTGQRPVIYTTAALVPVYVRIAAPAPAPVSVSVPAAVIWLCVPVAVCVADGFCACAAVRCCLAIAIAIWLRIAVAV
jgi:GH25 family lysozyme M1 (1,4-beta-N-acetylmuramidase)